MATTIIILTVCATVITSIVNCAKPGYKKLVGKYTVTVSVLLSFLLGEIAAFSVAPYLCLDANFGMLFMLGLALGTGSNIFYDLWEIIKGATLRLKKDLVD